MNQMPARPFMLKTLWSMKFRWPSTEAVPLVLARVVVEDEAVRRVAQEGDAVEADAVLVELEEA